MRRDFTPPAEVVYKLSKLDYTIERKITENIFERSTGRKTCRVASAAKSVTDILKVTTELPQGVAVQPWKDDVIFPRYVFCVDLATHTLTQSAWRG